MVLKPTMCQDKLHLAYAPPACVRSFEALKKLFCLKIGTALLMNRF